MVWFLEGASVSMQIVEQDVRHASQHRESKLSPSYGTLVPTILAFGFTAGCNQVL